MASQIIDRKEGGTDALEVMDGTKMNLRMIAVEASDQARIPDNPAFRWTAHHVKEIFLALLPKGFALDGSSKLQITCGPRGTEPLCQQMLGATNYFQEDFDFESYFDAKPQERERTIVGLLQTVMTDIATRANVGGDVIDVVSDTAQAVRERGFSLKLHSKKLSSGYRRSGVRVDVYRNLSGQVGEAWSCELSRKGSSRIHEEWMGKKPHYLDLTDFYRSSEWNGGVFTIRNKLGKAVYELEVTQFLRET